MREIKFRTPHYNLDGTFSHFSYWGAINHKGGHSPDHSCFTSPSSSSNTEKRWHEQYTGLKDKNGKEIYEGDVVDIGKDSFEVYYNERFASWEFRYTGNSLEFYITRKVDEYWEVIGNIHD